VSTTKRITTKQSERLRNTPVRQGSIYCAPFCGGRCTWAAYKKAKADAAALVKVLGDGWKPRVHENLGWHFSADKGVMRVSIYKGDATCYLNTSPQFLGHSRSPRKAVAEALKALDAHIASILIQRKALDK
jgi:hypothetical protein